LFGDWANLWRVPFVLLAAPFSSWGSQGIWVPWCDERYWWSEFDIYLGHYGAVLTLSVLAVPLLEASVVARRHRLERWLCVGYLCAALSLLLPQHGKPYGFILEGARYFLAFVPIVTAWGAGGALAWIGRTAFLMRARSGLFLCAAGAWFCWNAYRMGRWDNTQPFGMVLSASLAEEPVTAPPSQTFHRRVGYLLDAVAGPRDVVAVDDGYDTWLYPMFGKDLRRPIRFLAQPSEGDTEVPADVVWVAIDRGQQEFFFGHPKVVDLRLSLVRKYWGRGTPANENFRILHQLEKDPAFELVYHDPRSNQALFHRKR
jgi:hypothetical protein